MTVMQLRNLCPDIPLIIVDDDAEFYDEINLSYDQTQNSIYAHSKIIRLNYYSGILHADISFQSQSTQNSIQVLDFLTIFESAFEPIIKRITSQSNGTIYKIEFEEQNITIHI